jgi:hypothetical protein
VGADRRTGDVRFVGVVVADAVEQVQRDLPVVAGLGGILEGEARVGESVVGTGRGPTSNCRFYRRDFQSDFLFGQMSAI